LSNFAPLSIISGGTLPIASTIDSGLKLGSPVQRMKPLDALSEKSSGAVQAAVWTQRGVKSAGQRSQAPAKDIELVGLRN